MMTIDKLPTLTTPRLTLRRFSPDDGQQIFDNYASDPMVARYVTWNAHTSPQQSSQLAKFFHDGGAGPFQWAIILNETGRLIGNISLVETDADQKNGTFGYVLGQKMVEYGIGHRSTDRNAAVFCLRNADLTPLPVNTPLRTPRLER